MASIDKESELDRLYTAALEDFVKLRNDLAGRLKKEGDEEGAAGVAALKKPSVSAWLVNQVARTAQLEVQRLINAGEAIEQEQRRSISGDASTGFADARGEESAVITRLRTTAKTVLPSVSAATLDRVANTLRAGSATSQGRDLIKKGRLTEDLDPPGFEAFSGLAIAAPTGKTQVAAKPGSKAAARSETLRRRIGEGVENLKALAAKLDDLEEEAAAAGELARKAEIAAAKARKAVDEASDRLDRLQTELSGLE